MGTATRQVFAFLYVRRGSSLCWDLTDSQLEADPREGESFGATLDESFSDLKREWYRVVIEPNPGEEPEDSFDRAEALAKVELERRHPGHHVMS